jgi:glycosyltransferase involved in cell wall biosynthesis
MPIAATFLITDLDRGGTPLLLAALVEGLKERGEIAPRVVSLAPAGEVADLIDEAGIPVVSLEARGNRDLGVVRRFVRELGAHRPAVVCSMLVHANMVAALARGILEGKGGGGGIRWVQSLHTVQEKPRWQWVLSGMIVSRADLFVAPSSAVIQKLAGFGPVAPKRGEGRGGGGGGGGGGGARVIPNGIEVKRFLEAEAIPWEQRPWPREARVVGYIGRFDPVKRLPLVMEAVGRMIAREGSREIHLALVGYGEQEGELRRLAGSGAGGGGLAGRVHFPGATREPERWYKAFDVFCSPSAAEGFGLTLVEALSAGVPVVACDMPAVHESVGEKGVVWVPGEPTVGELVGAMERALGGGVAMPGAGELLARHSMERMIDRYQEMLLGLTEGRTG